MYILIFTYVKFATVSFHLKNLIVFFSPFANVTVLDTSADVMTSIATINLSAIMAIPKKQYIIQKPYARSLPPGDHIDSVGNQFVLIAPLPHCKACARYACIMTPSVVSVIFTLLFFLLTQAVTPSSSVKG